MKHLHIAPFLALGLAGLASAQGSAVILINEIRIDQGGTDNDEYFELFSVPSNFALDGLTYVVIGDSTAAASGNVESVTDLTGLSTNGSGLFVAAESTFTLGTADLTTTLAFENSDNVTHLLVAGFTGAIGDDLDLDDDGILDIMPWTAVLDAVSLVEDPNPGMSSSEWFYAGTLGFTDLGPDGSFVPAHAFRCLTSITDWRIGEFSLGVTDTPGAFNANCAASTTLFCDPGAVNSVSASGGVLGFDGSGSVQLNDNSLVASSVPNFFGVFVQADMVGAPAASPIGGLVCLSGTQQRMNVIVQAAGNQATLPLDFSDPLLAESSTEAGVTVYYQYFHRDTIFMGGGNWTNGIAVTWAP